MQTELGQEIIGQINLIVKSELQKECKKGGLTKVNTT